MADRLDLHTKLEELFKSKNVYYQPSNNLRMEYPCIRYTKRKPGTKKADDITYSQINSYEIIVISKKPDHPVINELLKLPYCSWERWYVSDNLNHDVLTLYY